VAGDHRGLGFVGRDFQRGGERRHVRDHHAVAEINYQARLLKQVSVIKDMGTSDAEGEAVVAQRVIDKIQELQRLIGDVAMRSFLG